MTPSTSPARYTRACRICRGTGLLSPQQMGCPSCWGTGRALTRLGHDRLVDAVAALTLLMLAIYSVYGVATATPEELTAAHLAAFASGEDR